MSGKGNPLSRRELLGLTGATALTGLAGCSGLATNGAPPDNDTNRAQTTTSHTTTTQPCTHPEQKPVHDNVVTDGPLGGFALRATSTSIAIGDTITFHLENVSAETRSSGVKSTYTIHRKTSKGWRDIFYRAPDSEQMVVYHAADVDQAPSEGYTWTLTFTPSELAHEITHGVGELAVCTPLNPGTYRFVYWGLGPEQDPSEPDQALGVQFAVSSV